VSEKDELRFGKLIVNQHDLEFQIETKVGNFTFKYLRPADWTLVKGFIAASLSNASMQSLDIGTVEMARAHRVLDHATVDGSEPPRLERFRVVS